MNLRLFLLTLCFGIPTRVEAQTAPPSAFPVSSTPTPLTPLMERELRGCFDFFWKEWMSDPASPAYGFTNSRHAAVAARQYAIDNADRIKGLGPNSWGISACISPTTGYSGAYGSHPIVSGHQLLEDGTVAPYEALSFLSFTPKESMAALEHMYQIPGLVGDYGLYDAYSYETKAKDSQPWIAKSYLGIDKGLVLLMFENYSTHIQKGLQRLEFRHVKK